MPPTSFTILLALALLVPIATAFGREGRPRTPSLTYKKGDLLTGNIDVAILWYGNVTKVQKNKIVSFLWSINAKRAAQPSVASWWKVVESYQTFAGKPHSPIRVNLVKQKSDLGYSQGRVLLKEMVTALIPGLTGNNNNILPIIVSAEDVTVHNMCSGSCWQHGSLGKSFSPYLNASLTPKYKTILTFFF